MPNVGSLFTLCGLRTIRAKLVTLIVDLGRASRWRQHRTRFLTDQASGIQGAESDIENCCSGKTGLASGDWRVKVLVLCKQLPLKKRRQYFLIWFARSRLAKSSLLRKTANRRRSFPLCQPRPTARTAFWCIMRARKFTPKTLLTH